jgi:sulfur relay (sulfurtransferase) complex TusBCD TusD component (DsrE family)
MRALVVLNYPPYGTERSYNGLRMANALARREQTDVRLFLMGTRRLRRQRPTDAERLLQPRAHAERGIRARRRDRLLRDLPRRPRHSR